MKKFVLLFALLLLICADLSAQKKIYRSTTLYPNATQIEQVYFLRNKVWGSIPTYDNSGAYAIGRDSIISNTDTLKRTFRTDYVFSLNTIPSTATIDTVILNYSNGGSTGYSFKLTNPQSLAGDAGSNWASIGSATALHTGLAYGGSPFQSSAIKSAMQAALTQPDRQLIIGGACENENSNSSKATLTIQLDVYYYYTIPRIDVTVQNDLDGYGNTGAIGIGVYPGNPVSLPSPCSFNQVYENDRLNLAAYDNQTINSRTFIFNDNEAALNNSRWDKYVGGVYTSQGTA